jgi:protein-arginine kinase activator protein McsA
MSTQIGEIKTAKCKICGSSDDMDSRNKNWCHPCFRKRTNELQKIRNAKANGIIIDKPTIAKEHICQVCGTNENIHKWKKSWCHSCYRNRQNELERQRYWADVDKT